MVHGIKAIMEFSFELERGQKSSPSVSALIDIPFSVVYISLNSLALKIKLYTLSKGLEVSIKEY